MLLRLADQSAENSGSMQKSFALMKNGRARHGPAKPTSARD
jgi:hypothetical protein